MTSARDHMSKADTVTIAAIEAAMPTLVVARTLTDRFHTMVRKRTEADLVPWIAAASRSLIASFASGITKDIAAVHAALVQPWSNSQTEGQITKLKLVKRQMYDRQRLISFRQD
jgi:transposase